MEDGGVEVVEVDGRALATMPSAGGAVGQVSVGEVTAKSRLRRRIILAFQVASPNDANT
jgi:hypothetical protein